VPSELALLAFAAAATVLFLVPGPSMLFLLARGIGDGRRAAVVSALGVETASGTFVAATALGLTAVLASSVVVFTAVRYLGAMYLVYLGVRALLGMGELDLTVPTRTTRARRAYGQAFLVGISNPKEAVFFLAFFPQFIDPTRGAATSQVLVLGAVYVALAWAFDLTYALAAGTIGGWLRQRPALARLQRFASGTIFLALGGSAAVSGGGHQR
jgi:threonine/homoserine/homoserine lactone efflux protein